MKNRITPFNWRAELKKFEIDSIDQDFILLDNPKILPVFNYPFKLDITVVIICIQGSMKGNVNLKRYHNNSPGLFIVLPDQILQYEHLSDDFLGHFIIMSQSFTNNLLIDIHEKFPLTRSVNDNPWIPLTDEELNSMINNYYILKKTVLMKNNPHRIEMIRHLIQAFFYESSYHFQRMMDTDKKSKHEILIDSFLNLVKTNFKDQRAVKYYADELSLTPKYLSKVVKENTGVSASNWINDFVLLEAKALLRSTNMTVQQISHELNFPSQSFFGKYFKRYAGVSPKEYRKK